jgi:LPXTG-motif cell wall-anchored protein
MAVPAVSMAAPVPLGTTSRFAVLAGTTITNTGATVINGDAGGDIGVSPGSAITGFPPGILTGQIFVPGSIANQAQLDLTTAYNDAVAHPTTLDLTGQDLGTVGHLHPGVYSFTSDAQLTGDLTLDAEGDENAVFVFKTVSGLNTASGSRVLLTGSARYCRVFWQVGSSATLGTNSVFVGHLFAYTSISAATGARVQGQLLARNGAVTLQGNTITNGFCADSAFIHITKTALPATLTGPGSVTYTYRVTNPGTNPLVDVTVTDDKLGPVTYASGDLDLDSHLDPNETWDYTATTNLTATTTNIATVRAHDDVTIADVADVASATVPVSRTISGGTLPKTGTPWYNLLLVGAALALLGGVGYWRTTRKIHA